MPNNESTGAAGVADEAAAWREDVLASDDALTPEPEPPDAEPAEDAEAEAGEVEADVGDAASAEVAEPEAEPIEEAGAEAGGAADAADDQPEPAGAEPDESSPDAPAELQPFRFRVDGADVDVPGAFTTPNGHIVISADAFQRFLRPRLVNDRLALVKQAREEGERRARENIKLDDHPTVLRAQRILDHVAELQRRGPEAVEEWAQSFLGQLPVLEARTEAELWKRRASEYENGRRSETEAAERERMAESREESLQHYVTQALATPALAPYALDAERVLRRFRHDTRTFAAARQDHPDRGVREGDLVVNLDVLREVIEDEITRRPAHAGGDAKKIEQNKAALAPKKKTAPVVSRSGAGQGTAKKVEKEPETAEEWRAWVMESP